MPHFSVWKIKSVQTLDQQQHGQGLSVGHGPQFDVLVEILGFTAHGGAVGHLVDHAIVGNVAKDRL